MRSGTLTFKTLFKASGTAGTAPEIKNLLKGAAFAETINASQSVIYDAASTPNSSCTIALYIKETSSTGKKYVFRGCRINWSIDWQLGQLMYISWTVTAADWREVDVTSFPAPTYQTSGALVFQGASITLNSYSGCIDSLSPGQRLFCLDLTEKSYAFVPECDSQEKCFSLLLVSRIF